FNIDGLPIYNSSSISFWPILCSTDISSKIFVVAIFLGKSKPSVEEYFSNFVSELKTLLTEGLDTFVKQIKSPGAYYACERCKCKGVYQHHAVSYPDTTINPRTNQEF
ncbi:hypothetical protein FHG87_020822, partial [Trinorchestia longiramus]